MCCQASIQRIRLEKSFGLRIISLRPKCNWTNQHPQHRHGEPRLSVNCAHLPVGPLGSSHNLVYLSLGKSSLDLPTFGQTLTGPIGIRGSNLIGPAPTTWFKPQLRRSILKKSPVCMLRIQQNSLNLSQDLWFLAQRLNIFSCPFWSLV